MVKCPTKTCVHAKAPPSGGGPGSFQLAVLFVLDSTLRLLSLIVSFWGSFTASEYASTSPFSVMLISVGRWACTTLVTRIYGYANALGSQIASFFDGKQMKLPYQISILEFFKTLCPSMIGDPLGWFEIKWSRPQIPCQKLVSVNTIGNPICQQCR